MTITNKQTNPPLLVRFPETAPLVSLVPSPLPRVVLNPRDARRRCETNQCPVFVAQCRARLKPYMWLNLYVSFVGQTFPKNGAYELDSFSRSFFNPENSFTASKKTPQEGPENLTQQKSLTHPLSLHQIYHRRVYLGRWVV